MRERTDKGTDVIPMDIHVEDLLADINGKVTMLAAGQREAGQATDTHNAEDTDDDGNREILLGMIGRLVYETANMLFPWTHCQVASEYDNKPCETSHYRLLLRMGGHERGGTQMAELTATVHEYIVDKCVAEWLSLTLPNADWSVWESKASDLRERIVGVIALPIRPRELRVKPHFF